jgi:GWxTD domain-containing protein
LTYSNVVSRLLLAVVLVVGAGCGSAPATRVSSGPESLTNGLLGPAYSQWLVGAIARMATRAEIDAYLALSDDFAAADSIEAFWRARDDDPAAPGNALRARYEERAAEADRRFSEAAYLGRRTARGLVFTLYGPPTEIKYEVAPQGGPGIEVWTYGPEVGPGLDGSKVPAFYRFRRVGEITTFYRPAVGRGRPGSPVGFDPP